MGERIHAYIRTKQGLNVDLSLKNALINMYAKCGDIETAKELFDSTRRKDVKTWTSVIAWHAFQGQAKEAHELFTEMKETNKSMRKKNRKNGDRGSFLIVPNYVTFIGVLMACSHAGMVEEGKQHFRSMSEDYGLKPRDSRFGCMVDLFCRAGLLQEAYDFISEMPVRPNAVVWRMLLGACSHVCDYVAMSNIYATKGMWDEKVIVRNKIKHRRAPGRSSIELGSGISEFVSGDNDHPLVAEIYEVLKRLIDSKRAYGYAPEFSSLTEY